MKNTSGTKCGIGSVFLIKDVITENHGLLITNVNILVKKRKDSLKMRQQENVLVMTLINTSLLISMRRVTTKVVPVLIVLFVLLVGQCILIHLLVNTKCNVMIDNTGMILIGLV